VALNRPTRELSTSRRQHVSVKVKVPALDMAPINEETLLQKRLSMARVVEGSHSCTYNPRVFFTNAMK